MMKTNNSLEYPEKLDNAKTKILVNLSEFSNVFGTENSNSSNQANIANPIESSGMKKSASLIFDLLDENNFGSVWDIFENEFPQEERRIKDQHVAIFQNHNYFLRGYKNTKGVTVGFISYWLLNENQIFIEHFAIKKDFQSHGYGSKIISKFIQEMNDFNIFLEVEDPLYHKDKKTCEKRIAFYKKNGFVLNEHLKYQQPSYSFEKKRY